MENLKKIITVRLVNMLFVSQKIFKISQKNVLRFASQKIFNKNLVAIYEIKPVLIH